MTRQRIFGEDKDMLAWVRNNTQLPSVSVTQAYSVSDCDFIMHRYKTVIDSTGERRVQSLMAVETKTRGGSVNFSQLDTLSKINLSSGVNIVEENGIKYHIRNWGWFILVMSGTRPDNSEWMDWYAFPDNKRIYKNMIDLRRHEINEDILTKILANDLNPISLEPNPFRRHHKTQTICSVLQSPLGFTYEKPILKRS